ncbi:MAG: DinB family protein [Actinomycetota bacterium]
MPEDVVGRAGSPGAWSVADVLWHVARWCDEAARVLAEIHAGRWDAARDPSADPGFTERVNLAALEASREMPFADARRAWLDARGRMLEAFGALPEVTADSDVWLEESGPRHYAEHVPDLERLVGG